MPIKITFPRNDRSDAQTKKYRKYIASPEWDKKRAECLNLAGNKCYYCERGPPGVVLQAHHRTYIRLGHEDVKRDLRCVCRDCHKAIHSSNPIRKLCMLMRKYLQKADHELLGEQNE